MRKLAFEREKKKGLGASQSVADHWLSQKVSTMKRPAVHFICFSDIVYIKK